MSNGSVAVVLLSVPWRAARGWRLHVYCSKRFGKSPRRDRVTFTSKWRWMPSTPYVAVLKLQLLGLETRPNHLLLFGLRLRRFYRFGIERPKDDEALHLRIKRFAHFLLKNVRCYFGLGRFRSTAWMLAWQSLLVPSMLLTLPRKRNTQLYTNCVDGILRRSSRRQIHLHTLGQQNAPTRVPRQVAAPYGYFNTSMPYDGTRQVKPSAWQTVPDTRV